jgi:hypothetical protein
MKRGFRNLAFFEAYVEYCFAPKHTLGEHLLAVRRHKEEPAAFVADEDEMARDEEEEDLIASQWTNLKQTRSMIKTTGQYW